MLIETAKAVVAWVAQETSTPLRFEAFAGEGNSIQAATPKGARYVIVCYPGRTGEIIVRSLLKIQRKGQRFSWLINGQASVNTKTIQSWGEEHRYRLTASEWVAEQLVHFDKNRWLPLLGNLLPLPRHLTKEQILAVF